MSKKFCSDVSTSSLDQDELSGEEYHIQSFAKQMLKGRMFVGIFHEKRYVDTLSSYRDVVSVSKDERDLIKDLGVVKCRIDNYYSKEHWTGITTPDMIGAPANHCVWVVLPQDVVFGRYWFKIRTLKFNAREAFLSLKMIRPVDTSRNILPTASSEKSLIEDGGDDDEKLDFNINMANIKQFFLSNLTYFFNNVLTVHNTKEFIVFMFVMLMTAITGFFQVLQFTCDFSLKFMRELSHFTRSVSPILIAFINFVGKSINGLFMLIAFMWRDRKSSAQTNDDPYYNRSSRPMLRYNVPSPRTYRKALPPSRSRVVITEVS